MPPAAGADRHNGPMISSPVAAADWRFDLAGASSRTRRVRRHARGRCASRGNDARAGGGVADRLSGDPQRPSRAVRTLRRLGPEPARSSRSAAWPRPSVPKRPARRWACASSRRASAACSRSSIASSTGCARPSSKLAGSPIGGPTAWSRPIARCEEKMALFWHGHFATGEEKIRDYRKMEQQLALFHRHATGNFRELSDRRRARSGDARLPRCRAEREGRAQREFRPRGDGALHHGRGQLFASATSARPPAPSPAGSTTISLSRSMPRKHDDGQKTFLGRSGNFDGVDILRIILEQKVTAEFIAGKIYRFFVREDISAGCRPGSARSCATTTTKSRRSCARCSCRGISTARRRSAPASRGRSNSWSRPTASSASSACPAFPTSTWSAASSGRSCSIRPPSQAGRRAAPGSRPGCCSRAAILPATCCSRTSSTSPIRTSIRAARSGA